MSWRRRRWRWQQTSCRRLWRNTSDVEEECRQLVKGKKGNMVVVEEHGLLREL